MRLAALAVGVILMTLSATPSSAAVRIIGDPGGQIGPYLERLAAWRASGQDVIIDGPCLSACTLLLGVIPRERICVTHRARLGFHAAWRPDQNGRPVRSNGGTQLLMKIYPRHIRAWLAKRGGLSARMIYLHGRELASMYRRCN
jgi:hypothetical protein